MFIINISLSLLIAQIPSSPPDWIKAQTPPLVYDVEHPKLAAMALDAYLSRLGVVEELNLQDDQKKQLSEAKTIYLELLRKDLGMMNRDNKDAKSLGKLETDVLQRFRKNQETANQYLDARIESILDPDQMDRLMEIIVLAEDVNAVLVSPQIRSRLKITEGQLADFERIESDARRKELELIGIKTENRVSKFSKEASKLVLLKRSQLDGLRRASHEEMLALLSDKQREEYEKMKAKPFKFRRPAWAEVPYWKSEQ